MISQSGGRQEEGSVEGKEVPSEISKLIDETISRIQELEFREDGSEDVEETMYVLQLKILVFYTNISLIFHNHSNFISESIEHFEEVATSLLNEASMFIKTSSVDDRTCDVDERLLRRSNEFLKADVLSSKQSLSNFLKESIKSQSAFEGMYFYVCEKLYFLCELTSSSNSLFSHRCRTTN